MYYGDTIAEKAMMRLNAKIKKTFAQAHREMSEKLESHTKQFEKDDKKYREMVRNGKLKKSDYNKWKQEQVFTGKQWSNMVSDITSQIAHSDKTTERMINGERRAVFQENVNYASYSIDKDYDFGLTFTIYDSATVTQLIKEDPKLLPDVKIDEDGYYRWNKQLVSSAVTQSIIQGETIPQAAERIGKKLSLSNEKAMTRVARTAMTSAQNSGRIEAMHNAQDMGIKVQKLWIATLDRRTRDAHGELDGQLAEVDEPFHSSLGDIYYPGDPDANPQNTWNCRCSLGWEYPEYQNQYDTRAAREYVSEEDEEGYTVEVPYMTYAEWKNLNSGNIEIENHEEQINKVETDVETTIEDVQSEITKTIMEIYENHRVKNGLYQTPVSEIQEDFFQTDLTGIDVEMAKVYSDALLDLSSRYDTSLIKLRVMTEEEQVKYPDGLANVKHDYRFDSCEMVLNARRCGNRERVIETVNENIKKGFFTKIKEENADKYVITHEFAHTLITTNAKLDNKTNYSKADYDRIKTLQKEIRSIYDGYILHLAKLDSKIKEIETKFEEEFFADNPDGEKMQEYKEQVKLLQNEIETIKISNYAMKNENEFMAECFALHECGGKDNEYTEKVMEFINRNFAR